MNNPRPISSKNIIITAILFLVFSLGCTLLAAENTANTSFYSESDQKNYHNGEDETGCLKEE